MAKKISLTKENIEYLRNAFGHFFPEDTIYSADKPFFSGEFNWKNRADFIDFVYRLTGVTIKSERDLENIKKAQLVVEDLAEGGTTTNQEATTPDKWAREAQEKERQKREVELKESKEKAQQQVQTSLQKKREAFEEQQRIEKIKQSFTKKINEQEEIQKNLDSKRVYAEVELPQIPEVDESINKFTEQARNYPQSFRQEIASNVKQKILVSDFGKNLSKEEVDVLADKTASDVIFAVNNPSQQTEAVIQSAILNTVSKDKPLIDNITQDARSRVFLATGTAEVAFYKYSTEISRGLISTINPDLAAVVFGPDPKTIKVTLSTQPIEGQTHEVDLGKLSNGYSSLLESQSKLLDNVTSFGKDQVQSILFSKARVLLDSQIAKLPTDSVISGVYNSGVGQKILDLVGLSKYTPLGDTFFGNIILKIPGATTFFEGLGGALGIDFGITAAVPAVEVAATAVTATESAALIGGVAVETGIAAVGGAATGGVAAGAGAGAATGAATAATAAGATAAAGGAAGAGAGAALGSVVPVVGTIIGTVVGFLASKIPWHKIKQFFKDYGGPVAIALIGGGAVIGSVPIMFLGIPFLIAGVPAAGGFIGFGRSVATFFKILAAALIIKVGKPILVTALVVPIVIALILFIINSGAYVVPPTTTAGLGTNPYIGVTKVPSPAGPFKNSELPLKIDYSVTITAKKNTLSNISIKDTCQIVTKAGTKDCPSSVPSNIPSEIFSSSPFTYTYDKTYSGSDYVDSLVINTVTVSADSADGSRQEVVGTAAIKIGNPPEDCPNGSWPLAGNIGINDVTQGPLAPSCSHRNLNQAMDIGVAAEPIVAVHSGIATVGQDSCVGKYVKITSTCGSNTFSTLYGHLGAVSIQNGQKVVLGQSLGITDNTGSCTTGNHLHFAFQTTSVPTVQKPYLIRNIPIGCCSRSTCNP